MGAEQAHDQPSQPWDLPRAEDEPIANTCSPLRASWVSLSLARVAFE